ncbi:hypothetical protein HOLleu_43792 [Holothuria leucospilota]|uniref:Uncharacterized protein n=1 Tax=Holothuria leucospilota TaxID=206669 RepID=A0A9Q0Y993_HOLLE|nr:hypothetical protein HOLleu_43792 [Holothuria leucospilota]
MDEENSHSCLGEVDKLLNRPIDAPTTPTMEALGKHIIKTKLKQSKDGMEISFQTAGQPLTAICVPKPRVASNNASQATVRKRTKLLEKARDFVSGGSSNEQLNHELSHANLQKDLHSLNKSRVMIPASEFLGLKADMCSSWKRNRELKSWLKRYGVHTECEQKLRQQQAQIIGDNLLGERLPFLFEDDDGTVIKSTPCVRVKDLKTKIIQQLEGYERLNLLTWHGVIPENEIWVKIGGDKGGATFKQMFQVANVENPNAPRNTIVFCIFPAKDSFYNLKLAFQGLQAQVNSLEESTWRGKKFRIFGFGDYEYLCKMYGLAGASGRHCCLWCVETKGNMKSAPNPDNKPEARTLATLRRDLERYQEDGARPDRMKFYNNVIEKPLFDIPLDQVCIPGLHISLGLFLKHYNSFEAECHKFDLKIASTMDVDATNKSKFQTTVEQFSKARALEEQASELEETAVLLREHLAGLDEDDVNNSIYTAMIADHLKEKENLLKESKNARERASSTLGRGPIVTKLDEVLQGMKVQRQAYHGKSFVGNHIHRCCQKENINRITSTLPEMVQKLSPQLLEEASKTASKFKTLFRLFAACHKSYNASSVFSEEDIKALELTIQSYTEYFRKEFPAETIPPKMHLLECHATDFIQRWGVGLGFHGEQGGESVHARLNTIRQDVRGLKDDLAILESVMRTHWVQTRPGAI